MSVISYVDDRYNQREWLIDRPIARLRTINDYLAQSIPGDVLIIHGGQADATYETPSGQSLLFEALFRVCDSGGRAAIFSGGQPMIAAALLRQEFARKGYIEGHHYVVLTAIQNLWHELDLEMLKTSKVTPEWRIDSVKRRHAAPILLSLALLAQAALIAATPSELNDEVVSTLGGSEAVELLRRRCAPPVANALFSPVPWQASLGNVSGGDVLQAVQREWPSGGPSDDDVRNLVIAIYDDPTALDAFIVSRAYCTLFRALARNQELQQ